ncbi:MAG: glycogen-binding domain-containing protein [Kiritimatiellae bacterium]|nr:glycogen-binding domain-containing protein [Kiritimatiellia bacterium]
MKKQSATKAAEKKAVVKVEKKAKACCAAKKPCAKKVAAKTVTFTLHAEKGKNVFIAGQFNDWDPSAKKMAYKAKEGYYSASLKLAPGKYEYKFVVDGVWCADPQNADSVQNDQGTFNSVITVK